MTARAGRDGQGTLRHVLAIDTATGAGAVALRAGEETRARPLEWRGSFRQAPPAIEGLLAEAGIRLTELDAIVVPAGPGSFTGLRVGAALALGLARIAAVPLHAVPTLAGVAEAGAPPGAVRVCATLDARRGRRYAAIYAREGAARWELLAGPVDGTPSEIAALAAGAPEIGAPATSGASTGIAAAIARLAAADPGRYALPEPAALELVYARPGVDGP